MQARTLRGNSADASGQGWLLGAQDSDFGGVVVKESSREEQPGFTNMEESAKPGAPGTSGGNRLLIVDGHCYAYRAFFAIRSLVSPQGQATNAIYGFIRMLAKVQSFVQPSHIIVVWDGGLAKERMTLLPEYKAQRAEMPSDLEAQLDEIVHYLHAANITSWMKAGCEADDCIAGLTARSLEKGWTVVVASSDKDFMQLAGARVKLLNPNDKTQALWDSREVKLKTGVEPGQIVDWLALTGDSVDNISGVPGVGQKTATQLINQFGSVEELYRRLTEVSSERLRTNLEQSRELVRRNQQMVRLNADIGCDEPLEAMNVKSADKNQLRQLFAGWGFKKLLAELEQSQLASLPEFN